MYLYWRCGDPGGEVTLYKWSNSHKQIISAKLIYPAQLNVGPGHGWDAVCMGVHGDGEAWRIIKIEIISPVVPLLSAVPRPWHNINFYRLGCVLGVLLGLDSVMKVFILR